MDGNSAQQPRLHAPAAGYICQVEHLVARLLHRQGAHRIGVLRLGRDGYEFQLGIAQGRQFAAKDAAGVDVDRVVDPLRPRHRGVSIDDAGAAPVLGRPIAAHRQAKFVLLAGRVPVQGKRPHGPRGATGHFLLHAGVRHHQRTLVEDIVAD